MKGILSYREFLSTGYLHMYESLIASIVEHDLLVILRNEMITMENYAG
jgi:hypothetical protein